MARSRESVARGEGKGQVSVVRAESTVVCGEEEVSAGSGSINIEGAGARRKEARGSEQEGKGVASKKGKSKDVRMESRDLMIQCGECSAWKNVNQVEEVHCMSSEQIEALEFTCRSCLMSEVAALKLHIAELSKCECNKALLKGNRDYQGTVPPVSGREGERSREEDAPVRTAGAGGSERSVGRESSSSREERQASPREVVLGGEGVQRHVAKDKDRVAAGVTDLVKGRRKKRGPTPIILVGDSMLRGLGCQEIRMSGESEQVVLPGARIDKVVDRAVDRVRRTEQDSPGLVVIQGGGNGLLEVGVDETVRKVMEGVDSMRRGNADIQVAVMGVMRRPREGERYEWARREVNSRISQALVERRLQGGYSARKGSLSYVDTDSLLSNHGFAADGVHLSMEGRRAVGRRLVQWIVEKEKLIQYRSRQD